MTFISNDITVSVDADSAAGDAFGRLRVTSPESLFDSSLIQGSGAYYFTQKIVGGGTLTYNEDISAVQVEVGTASGDRAVRQSKKYVKYEPGRSQLCLITSSMDDAQANVEQCCGLYDDEDGILFGYDSTGPFFELKSSSSGIQNNRRVYQQDWNVDTVNGSGATEFVLDPTKANIYFFDFQWLGVGRVRCGVETADGTPVVAHTYNNAGQFNSVYMKKANLPVRWEVKNNAVAASPTRLDAICCAVFSEGGFRPLGNPGSANTGTTALTIGTTEEALIAVRLKDQFNRGTIVPANVGVSVGSNASLLVRVYVCQDEVTGAYTEASEKSEYQVNPATIPTEKILIDSFYVNASSRVANNAVESDLDINADFDGNQETLLITGQTLGGNASVNCSTRWREV